MKCRSQRISLIYLHRDLPRSAFPGSSSLIAEFACDKYMEVRDAVAFSHAEPSLYPLLINMYSAHHLVYAAAERGHVRLVKYITDTYFELEKCTCIKTVCRYKATKHEIWYTCITAAAKGGCREIVEFTLNQCPDSLHTGLVSASRYGDVDLVSRMLPCSSAYSRGNAFYEAVECGYDTIAWMLLIEGVDSISFSDALFVAAEHGHLNMIKCILEQYHGQTVNGEWEALNAQCYLQAIHAAACNGHHDIIRSLILDLESTHVNHGCVNSYEYITKYLIRNGHMNDDIVNFLKAQSLDQESWSDEYKIEYTRYYAKLRAVESGDINTFRNTVGMHDPSPFQWMYRASMIAAEQGYIDILQEIHLAGFVVYSNVEKVISIMAYNRQLESIKCILNHVYPGSGNLSIRDQLFSRPHIMRALENTLMGCIQYGNIDTVEFITGLGVNIPDTCLNLDYSGLNQASADEPDYLLNIENHFKVLRFLVQHGGASIKYPESHRLPCCMDKRAIHFMLDTFGRDRLSFGPHVDRIWSSQYLDIQHLIKTNNNLGRPECGWI